MTRGRPPTPFATRRARGNPGRRPIPPDAVEPEAAKALRQPPKDMGRHGVEHWLDQAPQLIEQGILTDLDWPAFEAMCRAWHQWHHYEAACHEQEAKVTPTGGEVVKREGGGAQPNPFLDIAARYRNIAERGEKKWAAYAAQFGMTPAARTRVRDAKKVPKKGNSFADRLGA